MITEYHRPETLKEALELLNRPGIPVVPLGGGTILNRPTPQDFAVVDLQQLDLARIEQRGNQLGLGATLTLQKILDLAKGVDETSVKIPEDVVRAIRLETTYNLRQVATLAGSLVAATGRSTLATVLLALDVDLAWTSAQIYPLEEKTSLGEFFLSRNETWPGRIITQVIMPLNASLAMEIVARTPSDLPIVCTAVSVWPSGRWRIVLGGWGSAPKLALDGEGGSSDQSFSSLELAIQGAQLAARSAYLSAGDEWGSAEYRSEVAAILVNRCLRRLL
jgi:CO/xanthine dehydrogenase FAD-binding subunit